MIKAILFDFDGVLTKDKDDIVLLVDLLREHVDLSDELLDVTIRKCFSKEMYFGEVDFLSQWDLLCAELDVNAGLLSQYINKTPIDEEMLALAKNLNEKYYVGIITTNTVHRMDEVVKHFNFGPIFKDIFISASIGYSKREKEIFEYVLDKIGFQPNEILFIDNSSKNLVEPKKLGMNVYLYTYGPNSHKDLCAELERHKITF